MDSDQQVDALSAEAMRVSLCLRDEEANASRPAVADRAALTSKAACLSSGQAAGSPRLPDVASWLTRPAYGYCCMRASRPKTSGPILMPSSAETAG